MQRNKYHARKCKVGDEVFDSRKEMRRWNELIILEKAGEISELKRQVKFILIPSQRETVMKKGVPKPGKVIEREVYPTEGALKMGEVVNKISEAAGDKAILVTDVGIITVTFADES